MQGHEWGQQVGEEIALAISGCGSWHVLWLGSAAFVLCVFIASSYWILDVFIHTSPAVGRLFVKELPVFSVNQRRGACWR